MNIFAKYEQLVSKYKLSRDTKERMPIFVMLSSNYCVTSIKCYHSSHINTYNHKLLMQIIFLEDSFRIILTGGNCDIFKSFIENVIVSDDLFNSKGLNFIMNEYLKK